MESVVKENWFTRPPNSSAKSTTLGLTIFLFFSGFYYLQNTFNAQDIMPSSYRSVFVDGEYWRLWSTLFAHGDMGHLMNNALLFIPLAYLLTAYFGAWFFPVLGLFSGGLINSIVLGTMPPETQLIGISGVVYWMGGAWLTLFLLIDRRKNFRFRFANVLFLMLMLFIPETYWPHISYASHFYGFVLGAASAIVLYFFRRNAFAAAEVREYVYDEDPWVDPTETGENFDGDEETELLPEDEY